MDITLNPNEVTSLTLYYVVTETCGEDSSTTTSGNVTNYASWNSEDSTIAAVSNGSITGFNTDIENEKYTKIKVSYPSGKAEPQTINVTVRRPSAPSIISLTVPSEIEATATEIPYRVVTEPENTDITVKCSTSEAYTKEGKLSIYENTTTSQKTYVVTAYCTDYPSIKKTATVTQKASAGLVTAITLNIIEWVIDVPWTGGMATSANCTCEVTGHFEDGTSAPITKNLKITGIQRVGRTENTERHTAGTLTLTASYLGKDGKTLTDDATVEIWQEGKQLLTPKFDEVILETFSYEDPLTFDILSPGNVVWKAAPQNNSLTVQYRKNGGDWANIDTQQGATISVDVEDTLQFKAKGNNASYNNTSTIFGDTTCQFIAKGNIMSLISGDDFANLDTLSGNSNFINLFKGCTGLTDASGLLLPATTLADYCYSYMFYSCKSLTTAPELPATTLAYGCYRDMFFGCTSLTTAPELPAATLANYCYRDMFCGCTSLTTAPELPASTLTYSCYAGMFYGCTSLTKAPDLPATTLASDCYSHMFRDCTSLTKAPDLPATTLASDCYSHMFRDCTSLATAPVLPAATLVSGCYYYMFAGCESLNYIKCLATDITASNCTANWVKNVAVTGTFIKDANMSSWTTGANGIPDGWDVQDDGPTGLDMPLTFEILTSGNLIWKALPEATNLTLQYKKNNEEWATINTQEGVTISVSPQDKVQFRGDNAAYSIYVTSGTVFSETTCQFKVKGNIMSLIKSTNFAFLTTLTREYTFPNLFNGCTGLTDASELLLPATSLTKCCYEQMFSGCTNLTGTPELPATTLKEGCYGFMFEDCTSLTQAPELPAKILAKTCYTHMFSDCRSLTQAPELPATTMTYYGYTDMFRGCRSLTSAPELPAKTLAEGCYGSMFYGCTSLTTAPVLPATTLAVGCYQSMFNTCTSLTQAPVLPATTLVKDCYYWMFIECEKLNYIKCLATDISANNCTNWWVRNVARSGTFVAPQSTNWTIGENGIPTGWTRQNA